MKGDSVIDFSRGLILWVSILSGVLGVSGSAWACSGKLLYDDKFDVADPAWGTGEKFSISNGKATMRPELGKPVWAWNPAFFFGNVEVCVTVTLAEPTKEPGKAAAGLMFWIENNKNFFVFMLWADGKFSVERLADNEWTPSVVESTVADALKQGPGQSNRLRLKLDGQMTTAYINDKEVLRFRGQAPERKSAIGLYAQATTTPAPPWNFSDLKVTNLGK